MFSEVSDHRRTRAKTSVNAAGSAKGTGGKGDKGSGGHYPSTSLGVVLVFVGFLAYRFDKCAISVAGTFVRGVVFCVQGRGQRRQPPNFGQQHNQSYSSQGWQSSRNSQASKYSSWSWKK